MADQYQTTNRLAENTAPETPRLLLEGTAILDADDFTVSGVGFYNSVTIEITGLNDLGNRLKSPPTTLDVKAWRSENSTFGGQIEDYFYQLPDTTFDTSTGTVETISQVLVTNVYIVADQVFASYLRLSHWSNSTVTRNVALSYKIYSTIYEFEDA